MGDEGQGGRRRGRGRSVGSTANLAIVAVTLALVAGAITIGFSYQDLIDSRARLFDRLGPAQSDVQRLRASLIDQETGLRGWALTRDVRLLAPYETGRLDQERLTASITATFEDDQAGPRVEAALADVEAAMAEWRTDVAEPILDEPVPFGQVEEVFVESADSFDVARAALARLDALISQQRDTARGDLDASSDILLVSIVASLGLFGAAGLGGAVFLRRRVVAPIDRLVAAADEVAGDQLDRPIAIEGPAEIEHLAGRIDLMRGRIVAELAMVESARRAIDEQAAELARSNRDLEQFAYVASHDLQEPLRKVASFCQLLEQRYGDELDERGRSYVAFAVDGAKRMQALISDLLEFSRVGRTTDDFVLCDLDAIAREIAGRFDDSLDGGSVSVGELPQVLGDPILYGALLQNLIGNAIKYRRPDVAPEIEIRAEPDGDRWRFSCCDNGIGIDPKFHDRVFVIFQRLHGRDAFEGTGIGLAMCKKIVEFSGGRIWIDDQDGRPGTCVRWTLPVAPAAAPGPGAGPAPSAPAGALRVGSPLEAAHPPARPTTTTTTSQPSQEPSA